MKRFLLQCLRRKCSFSLLLFINEYKPTLLKTILSYHAQRYLNKELLLIVRHTEKELIAQLQMLMAQASNIKVVVVDTAYKNFLSQVIVKTQGEWFIFLDTNVLLASNFLSQLNRHISPTPALQLVYSDHGFMDDSGRQATSHLKSDFNYDLFLSYNYIGSMICLSRKLIQSINLSSIEFASVYDLILRVLDRRKEVNFLHLHQILYHQQEYSIPVSEERRHQELAALNNYLQRNGIAAVAHFDKVYGTYDVHYALPAKNPLVSLIIPTRDQASLLRACVFSIVQKTTYTNYEIIIVNNQSSEPETALLFKELTESYEHIRVIDYDQPFNYSALNNYAVQYCNGEVLGFINNDTAVISPEWLTIMVSHALREEIGCVGAKLYYPDSSIQHAGIICGPKTRYHHVHRNAPGDSTGYFYSLVTTQNFAAVTGACLVLQKNLFLNVGGFNAEFLAVGYNDVDLCFKMLKIGYRNLWTPHATLYHYESFSRGTFHTPEDRARHLHEKRYMKKTWGGYGKADPYCSGSGSISKSSRRGALFSEEP